MANERVQSDGLSPPVPHSWPLRLFAGRNRALNPREVTWTHSQARCTTFGGGQCLGKAFKALPCRYGKLQLWCLCWSPTLRASVRTSYKEVSTLLFSLGEKKGLDTHLKGPFLLFFKAYPSNLAIKASLLQTSKHPHCNGVKCHSALVSAACLLYRTRDPSGTDPPAFPPCRTWPILSKVSNKSQQIHDSDMELIMQRASFYSLHSSFFSYTTVFHCLGCAAGGMGSYLSLPRVLILGMLLPLADSSLLNSAQLLIKKNQKNPQLGPWPGDWRHRTFVHPGRARATQARWSEASLHTKTRQRWVQGEKSPFALQ